MRTTILIAAILIAIGIAALGYQGITYTTREKVIDLGPLEMTAEKTRTLPLPPIVGAIALAGGIVLLVVGRKKG
jgi:dipeptide/tripeptide permease